MNMLFETKALCNRKITLRKTTHNLLARSLDVSLYDILQRLIGRSSSTFLEIFFSGIKAIWLLFKSLRRYP